MLTQLVSQFPSVPPGEDFDRITQSCRSLLSAFWSVLSSTFVVFIVEVSIIFSCRTLYKDHRLCADVRIELAQLIQAMLEADREGKWAWIDALKKRRSPKEGAPGERTTSLKDALISLCNDVDHGVRMHMSTAITSLFFYNVSEGSCDSHVTLLPRQEQEKVYQQILAVLEDANKVMVR